MERTNRNCLFHFTANLWQMFWRGLASTLTGATCTPYGWHYTTSVCSAVVHKGSNHTRTCNNYLLFSVLCNRWTVRSFYSWELKVLPWSRLIRGKKNWGCSFASCWELDERIDATFFSKLTKTELAKVQFASLAISWPGRVSNGSLSQPRKSRAHEPLQTHWFFLFFYFYTTQTRCHMFIWALKVLVLRSCGLWTLQG